MRAEALAPNAFTPVPPEANGYGTGMSNNPDSNDSNSGGGGNSRNGEVNITYGPTRRVPASPSYFTGNADFFDNYLALQELVRRYQTLPTIPRDAAPHVKWKTLAQYRGIVGISVKAARYKQIVNMLARLNCIHPELLPAEVRTALDLYKRDERGAANQAREKTLDNSLRAYAVGRRKTSSAKVYVIEGDGEVLVNGKPLQEVFARLHDRESAVWPLIVTGRMDKYNVWATVEGGGTTGQAEAITLGVARALLVHEPALKPALRRGERVCRFPGTWANINGDVQRAVSRGIPVWWSGRSRAISRRARCPPGSSVEKGACGAGAGAGAGVCLCIVLLIEPSPPPPMNLHAVKLNYIGVAILVRCNADPHIRSERSMLFSQAEEPNAVKYCGR